VEETRFETLLRQAARHTTRRAALGALVGGALLLTDPGETDASRRARRRRRRRRRQRRLRNGFALLRGIAIQVDNTRGLKDITVQHGWFAFNSSGGIPIRSRQSEGTLVPEAEDAGCCVLTTETIPAGQSRTFQRPDDTRALVFINNRYWFQFANDAFQRPYANIALDGMWNADYGTCCRGKGIPAGAIVEKVRAFSEGDTRTYNIQNTALFTVRRNADLPDQKFFTVTPPPNL